MTSEKKEEKKGRDKWWINGIDISIVVVGRVVMLQITIEGRESLAVSLIHHST